jgi:hypothetical protein
LSDKIRTAFYEAEKHRPYIQDADVIRSITPAGGDWRCVASKGAITRSIVWNDREVALVNPRGDLDDVVEGQIAMAIRALPLMDAALRAIIVMSSDPADFSSLIRKTAESVIAYVEMPAPEIVEHDDEPEDISEVELPF